MSNASLIINEWNNTKFEYGNIEERIGFIIDNYGEAMAIYRLIIKSLEEADEKRDEAHLLLQKLRNDEDRWNKTGRLPNKFDAEEHQARKERLTELREKDYEILYKDLELPYNKLTHMIIHNMWIFKTLNKLEIKGRKKIGPIAEKTVKITLWPLIKIMHFTAVKSKKYSTEMSIREKIKFMKKLPNIIRKRITEV